MYAQSMRFLKPVIPSIEHVVSHSFSIMTLYFNGIAGVPSSSKAGSTLPSPTARIGFANRMPLLSLVDTGRTEACNMLPQTRRNKCVLHTFSSSTKREDGANLFTASAKQNSFVGVRQIALAKVLNCMFEGFRSKREGHDDSVLGSNGRLSTFNKKIQHTKRRGRNS